MKHLRYHLLTLLLCLSCVAVAQDRANADAAYRSGNYKKSVELYSKLLKQGESPDIYYNMGNAYYRMADYSQAMVSFLKAQKLSPADKDIMHNIEITSRKTIDRIPVNSDVLFLQWYKSLVFLFSINSWTWISICALAVALLVFLLYMFMDSLTMRKLSFYTSCLLFGLFIVSTCFAYHQKSMIEAHKQGVVMRDVLNVKSSPTQKASNVIVIHEGTVVDITDDDIPLWLGIRLTDGSQGWIPVSSVEVI
ncbi:MAG: tetratricopeptide repeat protein [Prevotella sp.]|nr:tetratricopeptide repeat protein [Prevotella sp.]